MKTKTRYREIITKKKNQITSRIMIHFTLINRLKETSTWKKYWNRQKKKKS